MQLRRNEILTGIFVLATLAILTFVLILLGAPGLFRLRFVPPGKISERSFRGDTESVLVPSHKALGIFCFKEYASNSCIAFSGLLGCFHITSAH